ncbi:hypothetical protein Nepgr_024067 [Nepenthes gracilis]|uniref:peptidylprolyl isomerase n=1 Tax=Nepenthes gracilis TaxID=150966 RepID=A0AAD3T3X6_NEPGR|nr:hypothetical protein Nepgr_024067 [Nepenthes gracilis]
MASYLGSPPFLSHPLTRTLHQFSASSSQVPPPPQPPGTPTQPSSEYPARSASVIVENQKTRKPAIDSTDWVASTLSRRFGLGAGLAWAGFLAVGVLSEQIKTRLEVSQQLANTRDVEKEEVILPNGIRYCDIRVGGGATPRPGDLVVIDLKGTIKESGQVFVDTFDGDRKPLALIMGSRPYTRGVCEGVERLLRTMKAGGKRRATVPPSFGFGNEGADFGSGVQIPRNAPLEYIIEVDKVSIAPA